MNNYTDVVRFLRKGVLWGWVVSLCACAHVTSPPPAVVAPTCPIPTPETGLRQDLMHLVAPGETLWRIGKMYDVSIADIMRANHLANNQLEKGQKLLIPCAHTAEPVVTLYPSNKWKYLVIHHSATDSGNSLAFDKGHKMRGFVNGVGYHFIICNGTNQKPDGFIEVSPRWIKQQDGAHCKAGGMNHDGIGICLVGNFNQEQPTRKQMQSLAYLLNRLAGYYKIPPSHIIGHGQAPGANTECPGRMFSWGELERCLAQERTPKTPVQQVVRMPEEPAAPVPQRSAKRNTADLRRTVFR